MISAKFATEFYETGSTIAQSDRETKSYQEEVVD